VNILLKHGTEYREPYVWTAGGSSVDCSGGSLKGEIRAEPNEELLGSFTFTWIDQKNGQFEAAIEQAAGDAIPDGIFCYDWIFTDSNGRNLPPILAGRITKEGTITETTAP